MADDNKWIEAWSAGHTPWDTGRAVPDLVELVASGSLPEGRALVPGAGSGYDVLALASPNREVIGLDLAEGAKKRFEGLRDEAGVSAERAKIVVANFFDYQPDAPFDMIWDFTFLCALEPEMRGDWARRMDELLAPGGELVTLIFPGVDKAPDDGPPYAMSPALVRSILEPKFEAYFLEPTPSTHPGFANAKAWIARWRRA